MTAPIRIGIVEDDPDLRQWLAEVIGEDVEMEVAFQAGTLAEAKSACRAAPADLCLIDIRLPDGSGLDLIPCLKQGDETKSLILTVLGDRVSVLLALHAGADGYLLKDTPPGQLRRSIAQTLAGETPLSPQAATYLLQMWKASEPPQPGHGESGELTPREIDVLKLFSRGLSYREAAEVLDISRHTIGDHVKAIHQKLEVHSRAEAIFEARQLGLLSPLD